MATVLLAEDERSLAFVVADELAKAGYTVYTVHDGETALAHFEACQPDLVILDWMLPQLDGLTVLRKLRERSGVPILMLTARDDEIDRVVGLEVGADDYVTKPFSLRELVARVHALLRRSELARAAAAGDAAPPKHVIQRGGVSLDPETYTVTVDGQTVDLTRTEFALLHLLMRNPGRVFNRAYLLDTIWGERYVEGDRSVDNAVLRLRKKLRAPGDAIETVWGVGYRWRREET
ncbi:MAG: response regulator transcription factor [Chloroflexota bacterium]|nr:MAG: DNA-binding response regulator [Chloroflexota bacterium]